MLSAKELMNMMIEKGASDLHLNPGRPPIGRLDGKLVPLVEEDLDEPGAKALARELCDDTQWPSSARWDLPTSGSRMVTATASARACSDNAVDTRRSCV